MGEVTKGRSIAQLHADYHYAYAAYLRLSYQNLGTGGAVDVECESALAEVRRLEEAIAALAKAGATGEVDRG